MPQLLPNRISKTVPEGAMKTILDALKILQDVLGESTQITDKEYDALAKIAEERKRINDDIFEVVEEHPGLLEAPLTLEEIQKDKVFYEFCRTLEGLVKSLLFKLQREGAISGAEYNNACAVYEEDVKLKVGRNDTDARAALERLKNIVRNTGGKKKTPPAKL